MGSQWFYVTSSGKTAQEAYNCAVDDAEDEHGHQQGYSGHINCSTGYRDVTGKYKDSRKSMPEYIKDRQEDMTKHNPAECICIKEPKINKNKIKTQVEHIIEKGTKKWVLKYVVYKGWREDERVAAFNTKGEAVKKAREITEKTQESTCIKMEKHLEKGSTKVANITYKKSSDETHGTWVFYGYAPC